MLKKHCCAQVTALDGLKAQLSDSLEVQQQLQSRATSLEEAQALVNEELRVQKAEHAQSLRQASLEAAMAGANGRAGIHDAASPSHATPFGLVTLSPENTSTIPNLNKTPKTCPALHLHYALRLHKPTENTHVFVCCTHIHP